MYFFKIKLNYFYTEVKKQFKKKIKQTLLDLINLTNYMQMLKNNKS